MASIAINKGSLDLALQTLLKNNFDADSSSCIVTLMKILDNLLQKPGNEKVRSIRIQNPAFANRVAKRKGGVDFLLACGFTFQEEPQQLLQPLQSAAEPQFLKLETSNEDTNHLVAARHMLLMCATHELKMKAEELPKFVPPPAPITMTSTSPTSSSAAAPSSSFNPYQGQRYDGLSAAVGARLGPDGKYISPTEQKLAKLQQKQAKLQETMHLPLEDRGLIATLPGNTASSLTPTDTSGPQTGEGKSDSSLLAAYAKKQMEQSKQQANAGFTTKAMRDLAKLEKSKVYSHVILSIQFPDGSSLRGKFLPLETVARVQQVVLECCRDNEIASGQNKDESMAESLLELYVTPPRRKLIPTKTLSDEGLVPASKVYVSWKKKGTPKVGLPPGHFLLPELFAPTGSNDMQHASGGAEFPTSKPVADSKDEGDTNLPTATNKVPKKKKAKNKEDDLLKRMMGRGL